MEDEFDKLMTLFSQETTKKEQQLDEIFQKCTAFFNNYKQVLSQGTEDEKIVVQKQMQRLQEQLQEENDTLHTRLGLSTEEIKTLSRDAKNFTPKQWEFLQEAQKQLFQEQAEQTTRLEEASQAQPPPPKKKSTMKKKSGWMKS